MKYRAEIAGLRALAVVPVILFHAGFKLFSGGFVGVDVFFVISGYLITTILIEDIENKRFSIVNFYERRARRILPALFFVMLVCIPFAWMWMLPDPLKSFGQSLVATTLFSNNILLSVTWADYWGVITLYKPLMHTWSLAVEEQYYVLFPIFLILAWRFGKNRLFWMIVVMAAISLLLSEWGWRNKAINFEWGWRNRAIFNFYSSPARAWELLAGSIAAFIAQKQGIQKNNQLAFIGFTAIVFSIFSYDETTPFPSLYTLVPVLGAVLIVLYAEKETFVAKVLSNKGFVWIGLISYSAYLWHQPLISFLKIYSQEYPTAFDSLIVVFVTILLSYLTWKFVEKPFRTKNRISTVKFLSLSLSFAVVLIAVGVHLHKANGVPERIFSVEQAVRTTHRIKNTAKLHTYLSLANHGDRDIDALIYGDSFAADIAYLSSYRFPLFSYRLMRSDRIPENEICRFNFLSEVEGLGVSKVIFAYDEGFDISCVSELITNSSVKGIDILFVGTKQFGENLNWLARLSANERRSLCQQPMAEKREVDIRDRSRIPNQHYFSFLSTFSDGNCFPITNSFGELLSVDREHFTIAGVEYFATRFFENENVRRIFSTGRQSD